MSCSVLHHVEVCVKEENNLLRLLTHGFGFHVFGRRVTPCASTWALRSGTSVFTVIKRNRLVGCGRYQSYGFAAENNAEDKVPSKNKQSSPKGSSLQMMTTSSNENVTTRSHCGSSSGDKLNLDGDKSSRLYSTESSQNLSKLVCCKDASLEKRLNEHNEHWTVFCCRDGVIHSLDSVFNIALVVKDVDSVTERVRSRGGQVLRGPANISDMFGQVRYSIVTSCCGNIVHTLIDKKNYEGDFLPGYEAIKECYGNAWVDTSITNGDRKQLSVNCTVPVNKSDFPPVLQNNYGSNEIFEQTLLNTADSTYYPQGGIKLPTAAPICTYIDHITYVCEAGKSNDLIDWYEHCFGMKRFMTNSEETEDGFVLGGNIGLRLKALEYWRCAEKGLAAPNASINDSSLKVVIAEPLPDVSVSHVDTFLQAHKGPGVQHIGLHSQTMTATVKYMNDNGVMFRKPPALYYQEGIKLEEIEDTGHGEEIELFRELGILLDTEKDVFADSDMPGQKRYLMQVFTKPIFEEDTFFFEVIQRCGATGFGTGNITALAKSIVLSQQQVDSSNL